MDVGRLIEIYAEFTRTGATYTPFPDPRSHRIRLEDLRREEVRERLRKVWLDPFALDPTRVSGKVTREVANRLAEAAKTLEAAGHAPESVAQFLSRCLFCMFAEDVGLLPKRAFVGLLESLRDTPAQFVPLVGELWRAMDGGSYSYAVRTELLHFNGKLFKAPNVLPLDRDQIELLLAAGRCDWTQVEPAIFGTLLERSLDPLERHALGAQYTPRAYVERLVMPTVIEPLREDWKNAQAAALVLAVEGRLDAARDAVRDFHRRLCQVRVLDPACGSGNFLYVTLEHMKRLEGEVLDQLESLGVSQSLETEGLTVDPHQFLGLELNPRAAAIAEMVLWIGYLQWHFRTRGRVMPPQPVLRDFNNIECRDAVLAYERMEYVTDERGVPVSRWDGRTTKKHPVTGEDVPDESARVPLEHYFNPRPAEWPAVDFVVGNPPFIGNKRMRLVLGDGYAEALRGAWADVPETADFVMYWWNHAATLTRTGQLKRFGLITTNSLDQVFNRSVVAPHLSAAPPLSLVYVIPDHPWVDAENGAAVRIAMTVGAAGNNEGQLLTVTNEMQTATDAVTVTLAARRGHINPDLTVGANVAAAARLTANAGLSFQGMNLVGKGFRLSSEEVVFLGYDVKNLPPEIKPHCNARDMMQGGEHCFVIDLFGYGVEEARQKHPALYQWLVDRVKPERDHNKRESRRRNWWLFGEPVGKLRKAWAGLQRVIITPETARNRVFEFFALPFCPDHKLYAICTNDAFALGVLSSGMHVTWALAAGGRLGVGNDPVYNNTRCFVPFPFPAATPEQQTRIRELAEQLDAHRKRQQAAHPGLTLTGMYNVLEKLRTGETLTVKERTNHEQGLISVLKELHDDLDRAVFDAYGWNDLAAVLAGRPGSTTPLQEKPAEQSQAEEELLTRLVALNAGRATEEKRGLVRWLRPEFQCPGQPKEPTQVEIEMPEKAAAAVALTGRVPWPKDLPEQVRQVADVLSASRSPMTEEAIAECFSGRGSWRKRLPQILETLVTLGRARRVEGKLLSAD